ncbi:hypothetical protein CAPTEDRAFT_59977, partial [Capitella teleta]
KENPLYIYILDQFRTHQATSQRLCREDKEMLHLGETYACLLHSIRKQEELSALYKGKGERSIQDSAHLVGLELP